MNDTSIDNDRPWLAHLTSLQIAWRDREIIEGRDPDPYIKAELHQRSFDAYDERTGRD